MKLYWCRGCGPGGRNFGDSMGPLLVRALAGVDVQWAAMTEADAVTVGSVMSKVPNGWRGTVLGTGTIQPGIRRNLRRAHVLAVRGTSTRDACRLPRSTPLGDPGILVTDLFPDVSSARPQSDVAIAPHYVDDKMAARHPKAAVVDVLADHRSVLAAIASTRLLITSSLHAMIAADALGVPHVVEHHPRVIGGSHKFADYCSAFGESFEPGVPRLTDRAAMAERQANLRALFAELGARHR
jgi:pyruvyltransferase